MKKIFIDGSAGTTGLRIHERLSERNDIEIITLSEEKRKDRDSRQAAIRASDISFLCLPDDAAKEAAEFAKASDAVIIDTSTAHRTSEGWIYGFAEVCKDKNIISSAKYIANPGCHASGFIALVKPLVDAGILDTSAPLSCFSLTGYSGGGKKMIADYQSKDRSPILSAPRQYALSQNHKHLKEMKQISGLDSSPIFSPIVADFYSGMEVTVPIFKAQIKGTLQDIKDIYKSLYTGIGVKFREDFDDSGFISASLMSGKDDMVVTAYGNDERIILIALYDNLGKGASGAAIQNMNIVLGADEFKGLSISEY